ncbi:MAG: ferredoxin [Acidobacteria bacterium]|nr:MAG: ferredoxin [Acidobacteriota bacterium]
MLRPVVRIDEELCDGCGECVPSCEEGAIVIENGKARLVADRLCDGLGACLGHCPRGAITVVERPAEAFDPAAVERHLARRTAAPARLPSLGDPPATAPSPAPAAGGCPGSLSRRLEPRPAAPGDPGPRRASALRQWPVQLRLIAPNAPFLRDADLLLAADCAGFAMPEFHGDVLDGRALAIACPKLDTRLEDYVARLVAMIDQGGVRSIHVLVMEVPCCRGLWGIAQEAARLARREVPVSAAIVGTDGTLRT